MRQDYLTLVADVEQRRRELNAEEERAKHSRSVFWRGKVDWTGNVIDPTNEEHLYLDAVSQVVMNARKALNTAERQLQKFLEEKAKNGKRKL